MYNLSNPLHKLLGLGFAMSIIMPAQAQITPDNTLGTEASRITPNVLINGGNADLITGGAQREINLFHSFSQFNINDGQRAYFANPSGVENIITRVTGGNTSNIFGTLGVDGTANLFLINPNGILFGENARLDLRGSFVGTTANGVQFGNQGLFNATNPNAVPLLTVNPSALFYNQINPNAAIQNNSKAPAGVEPLSGFQAFGLRVPDGKSLLLVGGNVRMDGGGLNAFGGNVELGGLTAPGNINLVVDGDNLRLGFPENGIRADVSLTNQASVIVSGVGGGDLIINAGNVDILNGSILSGGIFLGTGTPETVAGDIRLNATSEVTIADGSQIRNLVRPNSQGQGGNITINAGFFQLRDIAQIQASTLGQGNGGSVKITATNTVSLTDNAAIFSSVESGGVGQGGNIDIDATNLSLTDGASMQTRIRGASDTQPPGKGDAGNVNVKVSGKVEIAGVKNGFSSGIGSTVGTGTVGNGGNITIDAGSFQLRDGAQLQTSTGGQGNAGSVKIVATDAVSLTDANILSTVEAGGVGQGGNIDINAANLSLTDGSQMITSTHGASDTQPPGKGNAGNVNVKVSGKVDIAGVKNGLSSGIFSRLETGTQGNGGNINIDAGSFLLGDGGILSASTGGQGNAGSVKITTTDAVSLTDANIFSTVSAGGVGKGGNIDINAASLSLTDGAQLVTATRGAFNTRPPGKGDAGDVNVKVSGKVDIAGVKNGLSSGIGSFVDIGTVGNGGNITIDAGSFQLRDGAVITASTFGQGNAGNISVTTQDLITISGRSGNISSGLYVNSVSPTSKAGDLNVNSSKVTLDNSSTLNAESASGNGGNINLTSNLLLLRRGSQISTNAGTVQQGGNGGNINIDSTFIVAIPNQNSDITANAYTGKGGNINIVNNQGLFGIQPRERLSDITNDITASSELGIQGEITINEPEVDPAKGLIELAYEVLDKSDQIGGMCPRTFEEAQKMSRFVYVGRGGSIPLNSTDLLTGDFSDIPPLATLDSDVEVQPGHIQTQGQQPPRSGEIVEAQGFVRSADGKVHLVAQLPIRPDFGRQGICLQ